MENYHSRYKGVWYKYNPPFSRENAWWDTGCWQLSDRQNELGAKMILSATKYRIDQCFDMFFEEFGEYLNKNLINKISIPSNELINKLLCLRDRHPEYQYWKEAFELYKKENNTYLGMNCRPCYFKVYNYLKSKND